MARNALALLLVVALGLVATSWLPADPPVTADAIKHTLVLQKAMHEARYYLQHGNDSRRAVELLEAQLPRVNGNDEFLRLLRDAYRARIRDLYLASQPAQAETYLERLCVLEPAAAGDPSLRPAPEAPRKVVAPAKVEPKQARIFPDFGKLLQGSAKAPQPPVKPALVRAQAPEEAAVADDPFDLKHQRALPSSGDKRTVARQLVAKAEAEFHQHHYRQAGAFFTQAHQIEPDSIADNRAAWGYCVLSQVVEQLGQPTLPRQTLSELKGQVQHAVTLAPALDKTGKEALAQIDQRLKVNGAPAAVAGLRHLGRNTEGWLVTETANFRIFHKQTAAFAEQVASTAEETRLAMGRKWFGNDGTPWLPKCELIVHPTRDDYRHMTAAPFDSPGHARVESDKANAARIIARRMDMRLDVANMQETVLPHEVTHVVLAGQFGPFPVPRWADEGIAVLSEPAAKVEQHRQNLARSHQEGLLFGLKELMMLENYPEPRRISAFYAQSVALVEFLTKQRGPTVFTRFVRDGLRDGYDTALERHYGMSFTQLQQAWSQQVLGDSKVVAGN